MNSKFLNAKYLAIVLLGFVILLLISFDAFSKERNEMDLGLNGPIQYDAFQTNMKQITSYEDYEGTC